jgi:hypothetical protein
MRNLFALTGAAGVLASALPASAAAAPTWLPPVMVSSASIAYGPATIAMNDRGDAVVGWLAAPYFNGKPQVSARAAGSRVWSAPVSLTEGASGPNVALDAHGNAVAAYWKSYAQTSFRVGTAGDWQSPVTISGPNLWGNPTVAFDATGNLVTAWERWDGNKPVIEAAVRRASGAWQQPAVELSGTGGGWRGPSLAVDRNGTAVVAWVDQRSSDNSDAVRAAFTSASTGVWEASADISDRSASQSLDFWFPKVVLDEAGNATAVWALTNVASGITTIQSAFRPAGGSWRHAVTIGRADRNPHIELASGPNGRATVVWINEYLGNGTVQAATRPAGSQFWNAAVDLSPLSHEAVDVALAADAAGNAVSVWMEHVPGSGSMLRAALRPAASEEWTPSMDVTPASGVSPLHLAMDSAGNALAVWNAYPDGVRVAELRGTGPLLTSLRVPRRAAFGVAVAFEVKAAPWVNALAGRPMWQFGDGSSASGSLVTHVYRRVGEYNVSVTQVDSSGAASTESASVTVRAARVVNTRRPSIAGQPRVGATLTCRRGAWMGTQPMHFSYGWARNGAAIHGTAAPRYVVQRRDVGEQVACRVRASSGPASATATSQAVRIRK